MALLAAGTFGLWSERYKLGKELTGALVATLAGMFIANTGKLRRIPLGILLGVSLGICLHLYSVLGNLSALNTWDDLTAWHGLRCLMQAWGAPAREGEGVMGVG